MKTKLSNCKKSHEKSFRVINESQSEPWLKFMPPLTGQPSWRQRSCTVLILYIVRRYSRPLRKITAIAKNHGTRPRSRYSRWSWLRDFLAALEMWHSRVISWVFVCQRGCSLLFFWLDFFMHFLMPINHNNNTNMISVIGTITGSSAEDAVDKFRQKVNQEIYQFSFKKPLSSDRHE